METFVEKETERETKAQQWEQENEPRQ